MSEKERQVEYVRIDFPEGTTEESKKAFYDDLQSAAKDGKAVEMLPDKGLKFYKVTETEKITEKVERVKQEREEIIKNESKNDGSKE